jgi:AcrR family transcriptional regulator
MIAALRMAGGRFAGRRAVIDARLEVIALCSQCYAGCGTCWQAIAGQVEEHVVRYAAEHKQATRQRIIETAGRRLKSDGIDGSGVATLMADAGLTNGAFYGHFSSKDDLVAQAIADQLRVQHEGLRASLGPGRARLEPLVREYLSPAHRDNRADGCPNAALLDEIGRSADATRQAYTEGVLTIADDIAARLAPDDPPSARVRALSLLAMLFGTLQLSRALTDAELADQVLEQGIQQALMLLNADERHG